MNTTYLGHSGFLVELKSCYLIFDYYTGVIPPLSKGKPVLVFASHRHPDHYNPEVFAMLSAQGAEVELAVLATDILKKKWPQTVTVFEVAPKKEYTLPYGIRLETLKSTDRGVAFSLETEEGMIYHAGDLNDWYWEEETKEYRNNMTALYRREIDKLMDNVYEIAFLPLDPRLDQHYARGVCYFLEHVKVKNVYLMHFWKHPEYIIKFLEEYPQYKEQVQLISESGDNKMKFKMIHENYNVKDLKVSMDFYEKALGLKEVDRMEGKGFTIVYIANEESDFQMELTYLEDHPEPYNLGECEFHLAFQTDDYIAAHKLHEEMGCICYENPKMGIYFIEDPDGYWLEIVPAH